MSRLRGIALLATLVAALTVQGTSLTRARHVPGTSPTRAWHVPGTAAAAAAPILVLVS
ncbi:MAG: hypothetical protein JF601_08725, partial [Acidobacteria bacterium]|nr:hypothetical protein [Acidobacteriota bacterium]